VLVVVLPEVLFEDFGQGQLRYSSISSAVGWCRIGSTFVTAAAAAPNSSHAVNNGSSCQALKRKTSLAYHREKKHWLKKHAAQRVFVVFEQLPYCLRAMDSRVVRVEAEQVVFFFDSCMQGPAVPTEADREDKVVLCRVPQQKASFRLVREQLFSLVPVDLDRSILPQ